jgi:hypothetical protein
MSGPASADRFGDNRHARIPPGFPPPGGIFFVPASARGYEISPVNQFRFGSAADPYAAPDPVMVYAHLLFHDMAMAVMVHPHMVMFGGGSRGRHREAGHRKRDGGKNEFLHHE